MDRLQVYRRGRGGSQSLARPRWVHFLGDETSPERPHDGALQCEPGDVGVNYKEGNPPAPPL